MLGMFAGEHLINIAHQFYLAWLGLAWLYLTSTFVQSEVATGFKKLDLPVVKFDSVKAVGKGDDDESEGTEGDNEFTIHPEEWTNKMGDTTVSSRVQIPLRLAWSISVHKSQG